MRYMSFVALGALAASALLCERSSGSIDHVVCGPDCLLDVFMLVIGIGFFALAVAYASACDRL